MKTCAEQRRQSGFTWVSVLLVLAVLGSLFTMGVSHFQASETKQAKLILYHDISRALLFAREEAFLRGETLVLLPLDTEQNNWALGLKLQSADKKHSEIYRWSFDIAKEMKLTWHGFHGKHKLFVRATPSHLAMNGYFLLESARLLPERWLVSRFGHMRVLRKHVA